MVLLTETQVQQIVDRCLESMRKLFEEINDDDIFDWLEFKLRAALTTDVNYVARRDERVPDVNNPQ